MKKGIPEASLGVSLESEWADRTKNISVDSETEKVFWEVFCGEIDEYTIIEKQ